MNNKLTQEYKDDLYGKVLEKKRVRNIKRKKMLSIFIVFISVVGFTTLGFSLLEKEDYKNFFISETENITFNDEYEYFDDLGIKLDFINIDKNSLTLGINIKYENIAEYKFDFEKIEIFDENGDLILYDNVFEAENNFVNKCRELKTNNISEVVYMLEYDLVNRIKCKEMTINVINLVLDNGNNKDIKYKKEISIED